MFSKQSQRAVVGMTQEVLRALAAYQWPGNVRELRNVIERAVALSVGETIGLIDLPLQVSMSAECKGGQTESQVSEAVRVQRPPSSNTKSRVEDELCRIIAALERHGNNRRRAAAELGISRMTLYNKLHKYHQDAPSMLYRHSPALIHA